MVGLSRRHAAAILLSMPLLSVASALLLALGWYARHWWAWSTPFASHKRTTLLLITASLLATLLRSHLLPAATRRHLTTWGACVAAAAGLVGVGLGAHRSRHPSLGEHRARAGGNENDATPEIPLHQEHSGAQSAQLTPVGGMSPALSPICSIASLAAEGGDVSEDVVVAKFLTAFFFAQRAGRRFFEAFMRTPDNYRLSTVGKGTVLARKGEERKGLYIVFRGEIGTFRDSQCLATIEVGGSFGLTEMLCDTHESPLEYIALKESRIVFVPRAVIATVLEGDVETLLDFVQGCVAYQWRVATFILNDFFHVELERSELGTNLLRHRLFKDVPQSELSAPEPARAQSLPSRLASHRSIKDLASLAAASVTAPPPNPSAIPLASSHLPSRQFEPVHLPSQRPKSFPSPAQPLLPPKPNTGADDGEGEASGGNAHGGGNVHVPLPGHEGEKGGQALEANAHEPLEFPDALKILELVRPMLPEVVLGRGEVLYDVGWEAKRLFIVLEGSLQMSRGSWKRECVRGDVLGGVGMLTHSPYCETVVCKERTTMLCVSEENLRKLAHDHPRFVTALLLCVCRVLAFETLAFEGAGLRRVMCDAGHLLFDAGDEVTHVYVVVRGRVRQIRKRERDRSIVWILRDRQEPVSHSDSDPGESERLATFDTGRSGTVGEVSMFVEQQRYVSAAVCVRNTELVRVSSNAFTFVCSKYPEAMMRFSRAMITRLYTNALRPTVTRKGLHNLCTICLFPLPGTSEKDLFAFGTHLTTALTEVGSTIHVKKDSVPNPYFTLDNTMEVSRVSSFLSSLQEHHHFVVLHSDHWVSPWAHLCVANADCVLLVASPHAKPDIREAERVLLSHNHSPLPREQIMGPHTELVLVHAQTSTHPLPTHTRCWLEGRHGVERHHHVRKGVIPDYHRLVRHLTGRSVGVVLGGGGSTGFAHVGSLKAFCDADIPVDCIGGTGQGAIVAALFAASLEVGECELKTRQLAEQLGSVRSLAFDITMPVLSAFTGRSFSAVISDLLGPNTDIEDLWIPFFCVCTNLTVSDSEVMRTGLLWEAVRASMSTVGLVPPMYSTRGLLVDGGHANNLPADFMRETVGPGLVIACDVENDNQAAFRHVTKYEHGSLSGFRVLLSRSFAPLLELPCRVLSVPNPLALNMPSHSVLQRQLTFLTHQMQLRRSVARNIDLYVSLVKPSVDGDEDDHDDDEQHSPAQQRNAQQHALMDSSRFEEIVCEGYETTHAQLREWHERAAVSLERVEAVHADEDWAKPQTHCVGTGSILSSLLQKGGVGDDVGDRVASLKPLFLYRDKMWKRSSVGKIGSMGDLISRGRSVGHVG